MKKYFVLVLIIFLMVCSVSYADTINFTGMKEITVNDGIFNSTYNIIAGENQAVGIAGEDNETEHTEDAYGGGTPGNTITNQVWDYEGIFFDGTSLYVVGGFDFESTFINDDGYIQYYMGDLFFSDDPSFSIDSYKYAIVTVDNMIYSSNNSDGYFDINENEGEYPYYVMESAPYLLTDGNIKYEDGVTIDFDIATGTGFDSTWGGTTGEHYYVKYTLNNPSLWTTIMDNAPYVHLTMECGNDTVRGNLAPVPEPTTMLLSGLGLMGMGFYLRRRKVKDEI